MLRFLRVIVSFVLSLLFAEAIGQIVTASFTAPDTVCVGSDVPIVNTSVGASRYYWDLCGMGSNTALVPTFKGNIDNQYNIPTYIDFVQSGPAYTAFMINNGPGGGLLRLDFGSNPGGTPTVVNLGNFGNIIPNGAQGIQVVQANGLWYAIIVGGDPAAGGGSTPRIIKVAFGNNLFNTTPTATNWGNIGGLDYPHKLYLYQENNIWYGLTVNYRNSTFTRFDFGTDFSGTPNGTNLGNLGGLNGPTGFCPVNDNGIWRCFVTSYTGSELYRVDFGSSLNNTPPPLVNLGNPAGGLLRARDVLVNPGCGGAVGYIVNDDGTFVRLNFNSLAGAPNGTALGKIAVASQFISFSRVFRYGINIYSFMPNGTANDLTLLDFPGCGYPDQNAATSRTPTPFKFTTPGVYTINLTVNEGSLSQSSACHQVVAVTAHNIIFPHDTDICQGSSVQLTVQNAQTVQWSPATGLSSDTIINPVASPAATIVYSLSATNYGKCLQTGSMVVTVNPLPVVSVSKSADLKCGADTVQLTASGGAQYNWSPTMGLSATNIANPYVTGVTAASTTFPVLVTTAKNCNAPGSVTVLLTNEFPVVSVTKSGDLQCGADSVQLNADGGTYYRWSPATGLSDPAIANPLVSGITTNTMYSVAVSSSHHCVTNASIGVTLLPDSKAVYLMPNAFTPNKDGLNDCFGIPAVWGRITQLTFFVYNRSGQVVFTTSDRDRCWDGRFKGLELNGGNYTYLVKASNGCKSIVTGGNVLLIR